MPPSEGCIPPSWLPLSSVFIDELSMRHHLGSRDHENDIISQ